MGGLLKVLLGLFGAGGTGATAVDKGLDIVLEKTEDVDKRNALYLEYFRIKEETRRQEINRVTVPWVDAFHKMGRQLYWAGVTAGVMVLIGMGKGAELAQYAEFFSAAVAGGGIYTVLKGRGR